MRILYLIPGPMSKGIFGAKELERRRAVLQRYASAGVEVLVRDTESGPSSIESAYEEYLSIPGAMQRVMGAEREGIDAVIIGCFGDPGLDAARELVKMPVVGPAESSMYLAAMLGHSFSVLTVLEGVVPPLKKLALCYGLGSKLASVRPIGMPVLSLMEARETVIEKTIEAGSRAIKEDGADTLILGCMTMAFLEIADEVQRELRVPVVNPALAALKVAESLVSIGIAHSKKAYPFPPKGIEAAVQR